MLPATELYLSLALERELAGDFTKVKKPLLVGHVQNRYDIFQSLPLSSETFCMKFIFKISGG